MTRIGFFTGKLYDETVDSSSIRECCQILDYKEPILEDEDLLLQKRKILKERCTGCFGCEEALKALQQQLQS